MIEKQYERYDYEASIDLKNLAGHLLVKWKVILVCSIIVAVIVGVAGLSKQAGVEKVQTPASESSISDAKSKLSDDQIAEAEMYYSQMVAYDQAIDEQKRFNDQAYIMGLDPDKAVGYNIQYLVETEIDNASTVFSDQLLSEENYGEISSVLGPDVGREGLDDVINLTTEIKNTYTGYAGRMEGNSSYKLLIDLIIIAPDRDTCERISDIIEKAVISKSQALNEGDTLFRCTLIDKGYYLYIYDYINSLQQDRINKMSTLLSDRDSFNNNTVAKIDAEEKKYIDTLRGTRSDEIQADTKSNVISWQTVFKNTLIGLFIGCLLSICYFVIKYFAGGKLRTSEDLSDRFRKPVLKTLLLGKENNQTRPPDIITKWGYTLSGAEDSKLDAVGVLFAELKKQTKADGFRKVYLAADAEAPAAVNMAKKISEEVAEDAEYVVGGFDPDIDEIEQYLDSDAVIILPVIDATKMKSIEGFVDLCRRNGKSIIGFVPIRDGKI